MKKEVKIVALPISEKQLGFYEGNLVFFKPHNGYPGVFFISDRNCAVNMDSDSIYVRHQFFALTDDEIWEGDFAKSGYLDNVTHFVGAEWRDWHEVSNEARESFKKVVASYPQLTGTLPISQDTVQQWIDAGCPDGGSVEVEPFSAHPQTVYAIKPGEGLQIGFEMRKTPPPEANLPVKGITVLTDEEIREKGKIHVRTLDSNPMDGLVELAADILSGQYLDGYKQALKDMGHIN